MATVAGSLRNKVLVVDDLTSGDITVTDLVVSGTVTLQGTATTLDSTNTTITDSIIELNSGLTGSNTKDIGFVFERGSTGNNAAFIWDESADRFTVITTTGTASDNTLSGTVANFQAGSFFGNGANLTSLNATNISSGTLNSSRLPTDLGSSRTLSGANAILKLQETDVTNSPTWWHVADGGNYSIRLNNSGTYPFQIVTNGTNNAVSNIILGYNTDFSAGIDVTGNITVSGTVDGVDIAARNGVLTTTTNTANAALPKAGGTMTDVLNIHKTNSAGVINLRNTSDASSSPVGITFSSQGTSPSQIGHIKYTHSNALSYGALESFTIGGTETTTVILADGQFYYKDGIYKKPASGTGAGTRKDANWDTAYSWGNHADEGYATGSFLPLSGGTLTGKLTMDENGFSVSDAYHSWKRNYTVNSSSPQEILYHDGTSLDTGGVYRFTAHISGTGTDQNATAVFWNQNGTWRVNVTGQSGTASNHPEFIISSSTNKPTIHIDHTSNYTVVIYHEWLQLNEELTGTDNAGYAFGTDAFLGSVGDKLYFTPGGTSATGVNRYDDGNEVYHEGHKPTYSELGTMAYSNLTGTPTIPTNNNQLTNGAGYITDGNTNWNNSYGFITASDSSITNKLPLAGGTMTGLLKVSMAQSAGSPILDLHNSTNGNGVKIRFTDVAAGTSQFGHIEYLHQDSKSYGSAASFTLGTSESTTTILADGKLMYGEGIYSKPATGTGAGTRKDANWDTAYSWGNHADAGYATSSITLSNGANNRIVTATGTSGLNGEANLQYDGSALDIYTGSIAVTDNHVGLTFRQTGTYSDGRYEHRFRKRDEGGGIPLYIDKTSATANDHTAIARFGSYTNNSSEFEVYGAAKATEFDLPSGGMLDWANGDARIVEGLVNNYSLSFQTYNGSALTTALRLDGNNLATFAGNVSVNGNVYADQYDVDAGDGRGLRLWNGSESYKIYMSQDGASGAGRVPGETTSDYNMYFRMSGGTNRGFAFQSSTGTPHTGIDSTGNIRTIGDIHIGSNSTGDNFLYIDKATTGTNGIVFKNGGNNKCKILQDSSEFLQFHTNNAQALEINEAGDVNITKDNAVLKFGSPGNGANVNGCWGSLEGNTDTSGEGSGRLFFREHNSTTSSMDAYGMSLGYRGGATSVTTAGGNQWTGLSQIGNGQWGMWGHDGDNTGALIMYGDRVGSFVDFASNNIQGITDAYIADQIIHTGDTDTYLQFNAANTFRIVAGGVERFRVDGDVKIQGTTDLSVTGTSRRLNFTAGTGTVRTTTANSLILGANSSTGITIDSNNDTTIANQLFIPDYIYHSGDTNTYMQFHAADQWRVVTGGTERLEVNNDAVTVGGAFNTGLLKVDGKTVLDLPSNNPERGPWNPIVSSIRNSGRRLYPDEDFSSGINSVGVYNNSGGGVVTITREAATTNSGGAAPNRSGQVLRVNHNGGTSSPGFGGFIHTIPSEDNHTFVQIFQAKLRTGSNFVIAENAQGSNNTSYWLTETAGTGKWEWYARISHCGNTGTFSSGGHVYVTGGSGNFNWYLASSTVYDVTEVDSYLTLEGSLAQSVTGVKTFEDRIVIGDGTDAASRLEIRPADDGTADDIQFYNGSTRVGEIGTKDTSWLRINNTTAKNIYTPRYIRADSGFFVDDTTKGINGSGNFIGGTITGASDANVANWDTAYGWGNHASAGYATGSFLPLSGGTITGNVTLSGADGENALTLSGTSPTMAFTDSGSSDDFYIHINSNNFYILTDRNGGGGYNAWETPHPLLLEADTNLGYLFGDRLFTEAYHPNADTLTTPRTIAGTSFNGSADIDINYNNLTNKPTIPSISGLAPTASPTFTGDVTIPGKIKHTGDADTYIEFHSGNQFRVVAGGVEITEWRADRMQMSDKAITFGNWNNFSETALSGIGYAALNAPIHIPAVNVGSADKYLPILQGSAQHSQGYRTSYVLGGFKQATSGAGWGDGQSGFFMAMGGSDAAPTKEFRFTWDGRIWYTDAGSSTYLDFDTSNKLKFIANGGQRMEITGGGTTFNDNVALGGNQLENVGNAYFNEYLYHNGDTDTYMSFDAADQWKLYCGGQKMIQATESGSGYDYVSFGGTDNSGEILFNISAGDGHFDGDVIAYSTTTTSDRKLKKNIKPLEKALEKVQNLKGVSFQWKKDDKESIGFIAQEVQEVVPEVVHNNRKEHDGVLISEALGVDYGNITALLVEAVKEQQSLINRLEARIKDLENKNGE